MHQVIMSNSYFFEAINPLAAYRVPYNQRDPESSEAQNQGRNDRNERPASRPPASGGAFSGRGVAIGGS